MCDAGGNRIMLLRDERQWEQREQLGIAGVLQYARGLHAHAAGAERRWAGGCV